MADSPRPGSPGQPPANTDLNTDASFSADLVSRLGAPPTTENVQFWIEEIERDLREIAAREEALEYMRQQHHKTLHWLKNMLGS